MSPEAPRPPQQPGGPPDYLADLRARLDQQRFGAAPPTPPTPGRASQTPRPQSAAEQARRATAAAGSRPAAPASKPRSPQGQAATGGKNNQPAPTAPSGVETSVGGTTINNVIGKSSWAGKLLAATLVAVVAGGGIYVAKNGWPWDKAPAHAAAKGVPLHHQITPPHPSPSGDLAPTTAAVTDSTDASPSPSVTSTDPSCTPQANFSVASIPPTEMVRGTVTGFQLPITENYQRPGDAKHRTFKLAGAFMVEVDGSFTITVSAPKTSDDKTTGIKYDDPASRGSGNNVIDITGKNLQTTIDLSNVQESLLVPKHDTTSVVKMGQDLSNAFKDKFTPSLTLTPTEANALYYSVAGGDPTAKSDASKLGQSKALEQDAANALVQTIQTKYHDKLKEIYAAYLDPAAKQQQAAACVPEVNRQVNMDLTLIPDMTPQYPAAPASKIFLPQYDKVVLNQGSAAKSGTPAVPPTIDLRPMNQTAQGGSR